MADPTWAPTLDQVAAHVLKRTRPVSDSTDDPLGTFTTATRPTGTQVALLVSEACAWVLSRTGVPADNATAAAGATVAATLRAAGMVELGFPGEDPDTNAAEELLAQADAQLALVAEAADTDPNPSGPLLPVWSFPAPVAWGDRNL